MERHAAWSMIALSLPDTPLALYVVVSQQKMKNNAIIDIVGTTGDNLAWLNLISQVKSLGGSTELPGGQTSTNRASRQSLALRHSFMNIFM